MLKPFQESPRYKGTTMVSTGEIYR